MATREQIFDALRQVNDPEIGINIVDLGLVYRAEMKGDAIEIDYTLTYPGCPAEKIIRREIIGVVQDTFGIPDVKATVVWAPLWGPERMSEEARVTLGYPI
jgi:metal-sulfur cluster biosynthetic enzyme